MRRKWAEFLVWLIRLLPRNLAIKLGLRKLSPARGGIPPGIADYHEIDGDTGGTFRPDFRVQNPNTDPKEPYGGESASSGDTHGWNNCTMSSGAMALAYEEQQKAGKWGGDLRHHQNDFSGGTDLYDLETAWAAYGEDLKIKTGQGWTDGVKYWHNEGRAIVAQGTGECPGSGTYDGAHAAIIGVETHSDGRWLFGDPLVSGWQWVEPGQIKAWMERFHSGCAFATGLRDYAEPPEPEPPQPEPEPPQPGPEPEPPVITTPVAPVGWVPLLPSWALWDNGYWDAEEWHLAEAVWPIGWAEKVPIWDSTDWVGSWY